MSSKLHLLIAFLFATTLFTSGCSVFKDPDKKGQEVNLGTGGPECLSAFPDKMLAFFEGQTNSGEEVDATFSCVNNSLKFFLEHARGKQPNAYSASELQNFVNTYFTKEHKISDGLMNELMNVKMALFGGDTSAISRDDVLRVMDLFSLLKKHALILRHFMPLTTDHAKILGAVTTKVLSLAVRDAADETGRFFESVGNNYNFSSATALLKELERFFYPVEAERDKNNLLAWLAQRMELVQALKGILISPDTSHISKTEWGKLLRVAARAQGLLLQMASEEAAHSGWLTEAGLDALDRILPQALDLFHETREARQASIGTKEAADKIQGPELKNLITTLQKMKKQPEIYNTESDEFLMDILAKTLLAKQLLLGGMAEELDLNFLDRIPSLFQSIKKAIADFYPNFPIKNPENMTAADLEVKSALLRSIARTVGKALSLFHAKNSTFSFEELSKLQEAVQELYVTPKDPDALNFKEATEWIHVAAGAKGALIGSPYDLVLASQWESIAGLAAEGYLTYVNLQRPVGQADVPAQQKWIDLEAHVHQALTFAVNATQNHTLSLNEGFKLINSVPDKWMKEILPEGTTKAQLIVLLTQVYAIKTGLFPSDDVGFTSSDFAKIRDIVSAVLKEWAKLSPYLPERFEETAMKQWFEDFKKWNKPKINEVAHLIESAGENISKTLQTVKPETLSRAGLQNLLVTAKPFLGADTFQSIQEVFPLAWAAKTVVITPSQDTFLAPEWGYAFEALADWFSYATYGAWWIFQQSPVDEKLFQGERLFDLNDIIDKGLVLLSDTARRHERYRVSPPGILFENLDSVIDELDAFVKLKEASLPVSASSLKAFMRPMVQKGFGGQVRGIYGRGAYGVTSRAVAAFRKHVLRWYRAQLMWQSLYVKMGGEKALDSLGYTRKELLSQLNAKRLVLHEHPSSSSAMVEYEVDILKEMRRLIEGLPPFFLGQNSYISFPADGYKDQLYSYSNAWRVNLAWMMGRVLLNGYALDRERARPSSGGVTLEEFKTGVRDLWPVLIDLKMSNPTKNSDTVAEKRFREGNLFTHAANGDEIFGIAEWTELIGVSFSLGQSSVPIYESLSEQCPEFGLDAYGKKKVRSRCARSLLFDEKGFHSYFGRAYPKIGETYSKISKGEQFQMMMDIETSTRDFGYSVAAYEAADIDSMVVLFAYLESLFRKFDSNRDDHFDVNETLAAFPVVCTLLKKASCMEGDCATGDTGSLQALFGYLLFYGKVPEDVVDGDNVFQMLGKGIKWGSWLIDWEKMTKTPSIGYKLNADRARMLRIFATLSSATSSTPGTPAGSCDKK